MSIGEDILMRYKHIASRLLDIGIVYFLAFDGVIETKEEHET